MSSKHFLLLLLLFYFVQVPKFLLSLGKVKSFFHDLDFQIPHWRCVFGGRFPPLILQELTVFGLFHRICSGVPLLSVFLVHSCEGS